MTFANDCANCSFFAQRKKNFAFRSEKIAQKFCDWKPVPVHHLTSISTKEEQKLLEAMRKRVKKVMHLIFAENSINWE